MDGTTVTHPVGVPCSQLSCPICGSRLVNAAPGGDTAGGTIQTGGKPDDVPPVQQAFYILPVGGKPDDVPPVQQTFYLVPVSSQPDGVPPLGQSVQVALVPTAGSPVTSISLVPVAGGPPADMGMGGSADTGTAVDGPAQGGGQASSGGAAQSGRSDLCVCPMCGVTVTHPISVPCSSLNCPVCGSRLVNQTPGGTSGTTGSSVVPTAATTVASTSSIVYVAGSSKKLVIPSDGRSLKSNVATLLDEARYFMMFGLGTYDVVPNPYYRDKRATGAEIAQFIVSEGGSIVICNNISASALKALQSLKVKVYDGIVGTVQQALDIYTDGRLGSAGIVLDDEEEHGGGGPPASKSSKTKEKDNDSEIF